jgi:hypothetical protein
LTNQHRYAIITIESKRGDKFMKYNGFDIPDKEIDKLMDNLDISLAEACELWLADNDKMTNPEQEEIDKKAKAGGRHYEKSANPRKNVKKERKIDENKLEILNLILKSFENHPDIEITGQKTETELYFEYENDKYTVKLTKHRPKK